jgi:hypothetical protein
MLTIANNKARRSGQPGFSKYYNRIGYELIRHQHSIHYMDNSIFLEHIGNSNP